MSGPEATDLILPLHRGLHETPRWHTFLQLLQQLTDAEHVSMIFGQGGTPIYEATQWFAGRDVQTEAKAFGTLPAEDPVPYFKLQPGRVYSARDMLDPEDPEHERFRRDYLDKLGLCFAIFMRVSAPGGRNAWLSVGRSNGDFSVKQRALLASLSPHLSVALQSFCELEDARFHAKISDDALTRAGIGWRAEDNSGACIDTGGQKEEDEGSERLQIALADRPLAAPIMPERIQLARASLRLGRDQQERLRARYDLTGSEAALACALANRHSLAEAAAIVGLTVETARNYSKRIYSKTQTRGQNELIALILSSVITLA